jgi:hypothetical protein
MDVSWRLITGTERMKTVFQTLIHGPEVIGNCWPACIASLLEVKISEVPHFLELYGSAAVDETRKWLKEKHGVGLLSLYLKGNEENGILFQGIEGTKCIVSIPSPNLKGGTHAVVAEVDGPHGLNLRFVFDPRKGGKSCAKKNGYFKIKHRPITAHFFVR